MKKKVIWALLSSILLSFILYGNTITGPFIWDDQYIETRQELRNPGQLIEVWKESFRPQVENEYAYRPAALFSFVLNFIFFGESPASFHVVNIIINGIAVFLVWLVVRKLFNNELLALVAALLFAVLPIHTEAVANIKNRDGILAATFILAAWLSFLNAIKNLGHIKYKYILLSGLLMTLGILSQELMIYAPAVILSVFWLQHRHSVVLKTVSKITGIFAGFIGIYFIARIAVLGAFAFGNGVIPYTTNPIMGVSFFTRIFTAFHILTLYIVKTFLPFNLSVTYGFNQVPVVSNPFTSLYTLLGIVIFGLFITFIIHKKTRNTPLGIGSALFLVSYIIFSHFIFTGAGFIGERWMYFPSLGLCIIAAYEFKKLFEYKKQLALSALVIIVLLYGLRTIVRNTVWASEEQFYTAMAKDAPNSAQAQEGLAQYYMSNGKITESKPHIDKGLMIYPDYVGLLELQSIYAFYTGDYDTTIKTALRITELDPNPVVGWRLYALALTKKGQYQKSIDIVNKHIPDISVWPDLQKAMAENYYQLKKNPQAF